jgi:2-oxoisovalerate ferredoxin oxidoreductase beta subunit
MPRAPLDRPRSLYPVFERRAPGAHGTHYCPGCGHGLVLKYLAEAIDSLGIQDRTILISSVGCAVFSYYYLDVGNVQASHGRAPAVATGIKRARPDSLVVAIQGDGDLAAIGLAEIVHAANRGEPVSVLFVNNAIYGMTGGQMAPTTLAGQVTTTTPRGRRVELEGHPLRVCELLDTLRGPGRIERVALSGARGCVAARRAVRETLRWQAEERGMSFLEILSPCPVGWGMTPVEARKHVMEVLAREFPPKLFREESRPAHPRRQTVEAGTLMRLVTEERDAGERPAAGVRPAPDVPQSVPEGPFAEPAVKMAGFGGQGVLSAGLILAEAGRLAGRQVSWLPSYGPEMRGGTAHCHVRLARHPIGSPIVEEPLVLLAMNLPSLLRFAPQVRPGGLIVYNSSLVKGGWEPPAGVEVLAVDASEEAERAGEKRAGAVVALGALAARTALVPRAALEAAIEAAFHSPRIRERNLAALAAGWEAGVRLLPEPVPA